MIKATKTKKLGIEVYMLINTFTGQVLTTQFTAQAVNYFIMKHDIKAELI